ncbi:MAG: type II secretion system F family protein [Selenomonas sp.]|nr:type II secretion system F family protein [Selenomonas sp.]
MDIIERKISKVDIMNFCKIIYRHHRASRQLKDCLEEYIRTTENKQMKDTAIDILKNVKAGSDFAPALEKHPDVFPRFVIEFIKVGESTSHLDSFLEKIIEQLKEEINVERKIASATLMPKISLVLLFGAFMFAIYYLIPKISDAFSNINMELPLLTRVTLQIGEFFSVFWWIIPLTIAAGYISIKTYKEKNPVNWSLLSLRVPFYKDIAYYRIHYTFCEVLYICMGANLTSKEAVRYTALAINNVYMKEVLTKAIVYMDKGDSMPEAIRRADYEHVLNRGLFSMLETGIETSRTPEIMKDEAETYHDELELATESIGDKVSATILVPIYASLILFFLVVEWPLQTLPNRLSEFSKGMGY